MAAANYSAVQAGGAEKLLPDNGTRCPLERGVLRRRDKGPSCDATLATILQRRVILADLEPR
jgi:hypothetical protein